MFGGDKDVPEAPGKVTRRTVLRLTALAAAAAPALPNWRTGLSRMPTTLQHLIDFNNAHAAEELKFFGQERFLSAQQTTGFGDPVYQTALARSEGGSRGH